jgi:hypothetical protein
MHIDPVLELAEELQAAEASLRTATNRGGHAAMRNILLEIGYLENRLALTAPTSALGAAELLRRAAHQLQHMDVRYSDRLHEIALRLGAGRRELVDLIWLRALAPALANGMWGKDGGRAARLVSAAIGGAARPVLVYRSASHPSDERGMKSGTG